MKKGFSLLMIVSSIAFLAKCSSNQQQSSDPNHQHQEAAAHTELQTKAVWKIQNVEAKTDTHLDFLI